jgi:hypothetical protein
MSAQLSVLANDFNAAILHEMTLQMHILIGPVNFQIERQPVRHQLSSLQRLQAQAESSVPSGAKV